MSRSFGPGWPSFICVCVHMLQLLLISHVCVCVCVRETVMVSLASSDGLDHDRDCISVRDAVQMCLVQSSSLSCTCAWAHVCSCTCSQTLTDWSNVIGVSDRLTDVISHLSRDVLDSFHWTVTLHIRLSCYDCHDSSCVFIKTRCSSVWVILWISRSEKLQTFHWEVEG